MVLEIYNTRTRKKEAFRPLEPREVKMFVCGVTEYDFTHLGHGRTYAFYDTLIRFLRRRDYRVFYIQNVTDVGHLLDTGEDRVLKKASEERKHPMEIVSYFLGHHLETFDRLRLLRPDLMPRATQHIPEIILQIQRILTNGYAYVSDGNVYFDISKFKDYGKLSRRKPDELIHGARVEIREDKRNPADFALWIKAPEGHILKWESPWGVGYPGWHIEDTAIATKYFGAQYDIHGGAIELIFPHHEAEIAQAESATGVKPYVKYWVHTGLLTIRGERMGRSMQNMVVLSDAIDKHGAETLRLWMASRHYRKPLEYSENNLNQARRKVETLKRTLERIREHVADARISVASIENKISKIKKQFYEAMEDDLNTPLALSHLFRLVRMTNAYINSGRATKSGLRRAERAILELVEFFQIAPKIDQKELPREVKELIQKREEARRNSEYELADEIREKIRVQYGIILEDTPTGVSWRKL